MRRIHGFAAAVTSMGVAALLLAGCGPGTTSSQQQGAAAPNATGGVTSNTERALDSQPGAGSIRGTVEPRQGHRRSEPDRPVLRERPGGRGAGARFRPQRPEEEHAQGVSSGSKRGLRPPFRRPGDRPGRRLQHHRRLHPRRADEGRRGRLPRRPRPQREHPGIPERRQARTSKRIGERPAWPSSTSTTSRSTSATRSST